MALLGTALLNCTYFKFVHWQVKAPMYWTEIQFVLLAALAPGHACYQSLFRMFLQMSVTFQTSSERYGTCALRAFTQPITSCTSGVKKRASDSVFFLISPPFSVSTSICILLLSALQLLSILLFFFRSGPINGLFERMFETEAGPLFLKRRQHLSTDSHTTYIYRSAAECAHSLDRLLLFL